jgi:hypothetical protein
MIFIGLAAAAVTVVAFVVVVAGVQATDRRLSLGERIGRGWADAFARRVLGVYVRQTQDAGHPFEQQGRR